MAISYHPKRGTIVRVDFNGGFRVPEMVKPRLCIVISPPIEARHGLCTVVPLSTTSPSPVQRYHCTITAPFEIPKPWGNIERWVKADMVCAVGLHRVDLLRLGKNRDGRRTYQYATLPVADMRRIERCVLAGLGL